MSEIMLPLQGQETKKAIDNYKDLLKKDIKDWISNTFKIKHKRLKNSFFLNEYRIFGNPIDEIGLKEWLKENRNWLNDFDFGTPEFFEEESFFTHYSQNSIISFEPYQKSINGYITGKRVDDEILSKVIYKSIDSIINKYQLEIKKVKKILFNNWGLFKSDTKKLTMIITLLSRLDEELKQNKKNIKSKISIIGTPKNIYNENIKKNPADDMIKKIFLRLKEIKKYFKILDNGLTKLLSISNTKMILRLTIVMAFLTLLGVYFAYSQVTSISPSKIFEFNK